MQRYITGTWTQTNVNLNTRIYLRNEINVMAPPPPADRDKRPAAGKGILSKLDSLRTLIKDKESSWERRICNPRSEIKEGEEGGVLQGWKLQGVIVVTRHGDRGPMVHVRDADSVDCGVPWKGESEEFQFPF